jgi:hypothetical protein
LTGPVPESLSPSIFHFQGGFWQYAADNFFFLRGFSANAKRIFSFPSDMGLWAVQIDD